MAIHLQVQSQQPGCSEVHFFAQGWCPKALVLIAFSFLMSSWSEALEMADSAHHIVKAWQGQVMQGE